MGIWHGWMLGWNWERGVSLKVRFGCQLGWVWVEWGRWGRYGTGTTACGARFGWGGVWVEYG